MPILAIVGGVVAVLGVGLLYMTFQKAEVIVDNPVIEIAIVAVVLLVIFFLVKQLKTKGIS